MGKFSKYANFEGKELCSPGAKINFGGRVELMETWGVQSTELTYLPNY